MKEPAVKIKVPPKAYDPLATITAQRWNEAVDWRSHELVGNVSVSTALRECYDQFNGILSCDEQQVIETLGVDVPVNISANKIAIVTSWMRDLLANTNDLPFTISPTPIPDLSDRARREVLTRVKRVLFNQPLEGLDLVDTIRHIKYNQLEEENKFAKQAADNMMKLITDQCLEGGFQVALLKMIEDLAVYPFACMHGPLPTMVTQMQWSGSNVRPKNNIQFQFRPLSVFDFFWSPDCSNSQDGTGVYVRERMTKQQLYMCARMNSYINSNVIKVIEEINSSRTDLKWTSRNLEEPNDYPFAWGHGDTLEVIRHYGMFSGRELNEYGITGLEHNQFYNASVSIVGDKTIQAMILPNPSAAIRPVYASSFENSGNRIPGVGICQKLKGIERMHRSVLRFLMVNAGYMAGPVGEVDVSMVHEFLTPEDIGELRALTIYPTKSEWGVSKGSAYKMYNIPSHTEAFMRASKFALDLADRFSLIPASMGGEPVGTGANRTFRGMVTLQQGAMKPIQATISNLDTTTFSKIGELMYNYNMQYHADDSVKGDAKVLARGATGLLAKEMARQQASDTLQLVASIGSAAQGIISPEVVKWAVENALRVAGVPVDELSKIPVQQPAEVVQGENIGQQQPDQQMETLA